MLSVKKGSVIFNAEVAGGIVLWVVVWLSIHVSGTITSEPLLHSYAAQDCGGTSAEGAAILLMQCPLLVSAGIWNLAMVPAIARLLFRTDIVGSLTFTEWRQAGHPFNIYPRDVTHSHTLMNRPVCETKHWDDSL